MYGNLADYEKKLQYQKNTVKNYKQVGVLL